MTSKTAARAAPADELLSRLTTLVGAAHVIADAERMATYLREPRHRYHGRARGVVLPGSTREVAAVVALCNETDTKIVPQGGNTGLVGGQTPSERGDEIVLSLTRMNRLREIDPASNTMTVEAGMPLRDVRAAADA